MGLRFGYVDDAGAPVRVPKGSTAFALGYREGVPLRRFRIVLRKLRTFFRVGADVIVTVLGLWMLGWHILTVIRYGL